MDPDVSQPVLITPEQSPTSNPPQKGLRGIHISIWIALFGFMLLFVLGGGGYYLANKYMAKQDSLQKTRQTNTDVALSSDLDGKLASSSGDIAAKKALKSVSTPYLSASYPSNWTHYDGSTLYKDAYNPLAFYAQSPPYSGSNASGSIIEIDYPISKQIYQYKSPDEQQKLFEELQYPSEEKVTSARYQVDGEESFSLDMLYIPSEKMTIQKPSFSRIVYIPKGNSVYVMKWRIVSASTMDILEKIKKRDEPGFLAIIQSLTLIDLPAPTRPQTSTTPTPTAVPYITPTTQPTVALYTISGYAFNDANNNLIKDSGEQTFPGVYIAFLSLGKSMTTDANGYYSLSNLIPAKYNITANSPSGYTSSTSNPAFTTITGNTTVNFGFKASN